MHFRTLVLIPLLLLTACEQASESPAAAPSLERITGSVAYRERIALSPNAKLKIELLDVSRADISATTLVSKMISGPGAPPIDFALDYDPATIQERMTYVVRAEIRDGDTLVFTTDRAYPVLTGGAGSEVELMLVAVNYSPPPSAGLLDTHWQLIEIEGQPVTVQSPPEDMHLVFAMEGNVVAGYAGCNRFSGAIVRDGDTLSFGPLAVTMRACIDSMDLEADFLGALARIDRVEVKEQELQAFGQDKLLLTFLAANQD